MKKFECIIQDFLAYGLMISVASVVPAYGTHIYWLVKGLVTGSLDTASETVLAILGVLIPPIGTVHGYYLWFI